MTQRNDSSRYGAHVNHHTDNERIRDERVPDPYETQRSVHSYATEQVPPRWNPTPTDDFAQQGLSRDQFRSTGMYQPPRASSPWEQQPARYGGGYRDDEPCRRRRVGCRLRADWRQPPGPDEHNRYGRGQSNSGYRTSPDLGERAHEPRFEAPGDYAGTRDPRLSGHYDRQGRGGYGSQGDRADTYGSAGYRQQGKRYRFDESGQAPSPHRGVGPRGYVRSDDRLREIVCERLTEADLDASDIEVQVAEGMVTLDGTVPDRQTRHLAEDVVDDCGGVKDIHNNLRVGRDRTPASATGVTSSDDSSTEGSGRKH